MSELKFYMNNPCVITREVAGGEFYEVKLNPEYAQSMDGSEFCTGCILGPMDGAHPRHSCEDLGVIIAAINDQEASIIVIVEARLVHDKPVQAITYSALQAKIEAQRDKLAESYRIDTDARLKLSEYEGREKRSIAAISKLEAKIEVLARQIENAERRLQSARDSYASSLTVASENISLNGEALKQLYRDSFTLSELINGGVDNWEYYDDARPSSEAVEEYASASIGAA